jgi:hypothetical protein
MYLPPSKKFKICKKGLITLITFSHIFICKARISLSNESKFLDPLENSNDVTFMLIVSAIVVVKVSDNNQWPLD